MTRIALRRPICLLGIFTILAVLAGAAAAADWVEYRNERFGFSLQYPADVFAVERTTEAGDGQVFVANEGEARLLVGALVNETGYTPATYKDYVARNSYSEYEIRYHRLGGSWLVLSGEGNGRVFYEKAMFSCGGRLINSFAMLYPKDQGHVFDRIVERIEKTFRPGRDCNHASLPPLQSDRLQKARYAKQFKGQRSALADRIARARGNNVVIVVRRTTPPYDQKVLRGYASRP